MTTAVSRGRTDIPKVSGGGAVLGHLQELRHDPIGLLKRVRSECGEVGEFRMLDRTVVLLSGERAQETFFRAARRPARPHPDVELAHEADLRRRRRLRPPPERRRETLRTPALRDENLASRPAASRTRPEAMLDRLGESGEMDLLEFTTELTIYTSSATLIGPSFPRADSPPSSRTRTTTSRRAPTRWRTWRRTCRWARSCARRRRRRLVELITEIVERAPPHRQRERDMLQVLLTLTNDDGTPAVHADQMTGFLISTLFAGTTRAQRLPAWTLIELLRHPSHMQRVLAELATIYAGEATSHIKRYVRFRTWSTRSKRRCGCIPPLIMLPRTAVADFSVRRLDDRSRQARRRFPALSHLDPRCFAIPSVRPRPLREGR
jgi:sterol 14-demethylase